MIPPYGVEMPQPQDLVLTILGAHVRRPGEKVWSGGMVDLLSSFGFSRGAARAALARLVLRDLLVRARRARFVYYVLGTRTEILLAEGDRRIFSFGRTAPAVDVWTVLWHSIPEGQRVERFRFASRLRFLGFGSVQDATWVAPRDREQEVRTLLRELRIEEYASLFIGRLSEDLPLTALIAQAWRLESVALRYEAFLATYKPLGRPSERKRLTSEQAFVSRTLMLHQFRAFPFMDPELPPSADPLRKLRREVVATFDRVYRALEAEATEHFRAVAQPE
jgi:phenylacetic acid degradation operon negative regulatory protein